LDRTPPTHHPQNREEQQAVSTTTIPSRIEAALQAHSTGAFFDALDRVDNTISYNQTVAAAAGNPDTYAGCCCGAEYVAYSTEIVLDDDEINAAAERLADRYGGVSSDFYRGHVIDVIGGINWLRGQRDNNAANDFYLDHEGCQVVADLVFGGDR
jgi:hypothetical protein